ncbi:tripartite tricarboxylate transporter TctB family protein [Georgenia alba]|uniref:Tripartite tricarboxylate transporter TctB family protein n=1 Tax=Georgenia alba TaxID=2233858 RepID=A0ABW2Q5G1_9MICO
MSPEHGADGRRPIARSDLYVGAAAVVGGLAVIPYALSMPEYEGLPGPGLFPAIIGGFAVLFGLALVLKAVLEARRGRAAAAPQQEVPAEEDATAPEQTEGAVRTTLATSERARWLNAGVVLGSIVFYLLVAETLGFLLTMFVILAAIMLVLRSRVVVALVTAACATALLYAVFELGLLVQLPDGLVGW